MGKVFGEGANREYVTFGVVSGCMITFMNGPVSYKDNTVFFR